MADTAALLAQLRDIRVPDAPEEPAVWPVALALVLIVMATAVLVNFFWKKRASWVLEAKLELQNAQRQSPDVAIQAYARLLKRVVLTLDPQSDLRTLHGAKWLQHLDGVFHTDYFSSGQGRIFGEALYQQQTTSELERDDIAAHLHSLFKRRGFKLW